MDRVEALDSVRHRSLFSLFDPGEASTLEEASALMHVPAGRPVPRLVTPSQLFIVAEGSIIQCPPGEPGTEVGAVSRGRSIELDTLLSGASAWETDWIAGEDSKLLVAPASIFAAMLARSPEVERYLRLIISEVGARRLENDLLLYGLGAREIVQLLSFAERGLWSDHLGGLSPGDDEATDPMGTVSRGLTIVSKGWIEADAERAGRSHRFGPFRRGDYFLADASKASFESEDDTEVLFLPLEKLIERLGTATIASFLEIADPITVKLASVDRSPAAPRTVTTRRFEEEEEELDDVDLDRFKADPTALRRLYRKKRPTTRQRDELDCGAACLATVARFHGKRIELAEYRSLVHVTRDGASMLGLKLAAERTGFVAAGVMAGVKAMRQMKSPFIALMKFHFVVVYEISDKHVSISDPARGLVDMTLEDFAEDWSRSALLLDPTDAFFAREESPSSYRKYLGLLRGSVSLAFEVLLASILAFGLSLGLPIFLQYFIDSVLPRGDRGGLAILGVALLAVILSRDVISWIQSRISITLATRLDTMLSVVLFHKLMRLPLSFFSVRTVGDITRRMAELESVRRLALDHSMRLLIALIGGLISSTIIGIYSLRLLAAMLLGLSAPVVFILILAPRLSKRLGRLHVAEGETSTRTWEQFQGLASLKGLGAEVAARWRWTHDFARTLDERRKLSGLSAITQAGSEFFKLGLQAFVLLVAVYLFSVGEVSLGSVVAVSSLAGTAIGSVVQILEGSFSFAELGVSMARIDDVMTAAEEDAGGADDDDQALTGGVELQRVSFQYGGDLSPIVLDQVSFRIQPGETVAIVGRSGSGKTTLGYLFNLLHSPTEGSIRFDGRDSRELSLERIRTGVAMIVQENAIFSGTILENIALGDPNPSFQHVMEAARLADAHDFIVGLPDGYMTRLGESGEGLSGGQKQRINIARALYRDPAVLVMDEATSALDAVSEAKIVRNLKSHRGSKVVIAHRLNTVMNADRIVVLDEGQIVEEGPHQELIARRGHYHRLFAKQLAL